MEFQLTTFRCDGKQMVGLDGELDMQSAPQVDELLERLAAEDVVVDMGRLSFCDSCGLSALIRARRRFDHAGGTMRLTNLQPKVQRLLTITDTCGFFNVVDSRVESSAGLDSVR